MIPFKTFQRLTAAALAAALVTPLSAFAESRRFSETDTTRIAANVLGAILGTRTTATSRERAVTRRNTDAPAVRSVQSGPISAQSVLDAMNTERRARGLAPLRLDARLNAAAADRARDMFDQRYFDHVAPDGTQPFTWVRHRSYRYSTVGENLAQGYRSARATVDGWMRSPGHRANLLGRSFADAGIAIVRGSPDGRTNGYTVVALYASEAGTGSRRSLTYATR